MALFRSQPWLLFSLGSAFFAALTAIFGKVGVARINSDLATFIRTVVILGVTALLVTAHGAWKVEQGGMPARSVVFLILSGIATGLSWVCYYRALQLGPASRVAPVDKLSVVLVIFLSVLFLHETLTWKVAAGGLLVAAGAVLLAL